MLRHVLIAVCVVCTSELTLANVESVEVNAHFGREHEARDQVQQVSHSIGHAIRFEFEATGRAGMGSNLAAAVYPINLEPRRMLPESLLEVWLQVLFVFGSFAKLSEAIELGRLPASDWVVGSGFEMYSLVRG